MYVDFHSILQASEGGGAALHPEPIVHSLTTQGVTLDVAMAPRFRRTRISDYLTLSQAWVVYFEATVRYHPHLLPHLAAYQVDMNRYARDYPPYAWVAFDAEFRQSVSNNPGVSWDRLHSMAFHRYLRGAPPASPRPRDDGGRGGGWRERPPRGPPTPGGSPYASEWFGAARRPLPGLQRPVVHAGRLPIRTQLHTMRWHTPCVFLSTSVTRGTARFASWRGALAAGGASLTRGRSSAPRPSEGPPRRSLVRYLWSGFTFGFALGYRGPVTPARPRNLLSARSRRSAVTAAVALEVSRGHTAGPFVRPPFRLFHCSPSAPQ